MDTKIDFVITWVNGNDHKWLKEKEKYLLSNLGLSSSENRYRNWDNLKYWFRGVEKFAPWVNNIYFITCGQTPKWLNTNHPKLKLINHQDYIPQEFLPTFNSNTIELFINKIPGLQEHFVLFNDDTFIIKPVSKKDFFINNLPTDSYAHNVIIPFGTSDKFPHCLINNIDIINKHFNKRQDMKLHFSKCFNMKYGINNLRTIFLLPWYAYTGFYNPHIPVSYLKSTFNEVWSLEDSTLKSSLNRFRSYSDISHWLMRYWQLVKGEFIPRKNSIGKMITASENPTELNKALKNRKCKLLCLNDDNLSINFDIAKNNINYEFEKLFPQKSKFEK